MGLMLDTIRKLIAGYLQKEVPGYEPFTPSDPEHLRGVIEPGDVLLVEGNWRTPCFRSILPIPGEPDEAARRASPESPAMRLEELNFSVIPAGSAQATAIDLDMIDGLLSRKMVHRSGAGGVRRFELYKGEAGHWRWRLKSANGPPCAGRSFLHYCALQSALLPPFSRSMPA